MRFSEVCCDKTRPNQLRFSCSSDYPQPSMSNSDFGELVWENGQVVIKGGQLTKVSRFSNMDSFINSETGTSRTRTNVGFDEAVVGDDDPDIIPWFYHLDDVLHHESTSGLLAEASGVTSNDFPSYTKFSVAHKLSNHVKDSALAALHYSGSRVSSVASNDKVCKYNIESDSLGDPLSVMKLQKKNDEQDTVFSQGVAKAKNDPDSDGTRANDELLTDETSAAKDGMLVKTNGKTMDATRKCLPSGSVEKQATMDGEDGLNLKQFIGANALPGYIGVAAPLSVCSDNNGLKGSNGPTYHSKRKHSDEEDCDYSSENAEEESTSIRRAGCKRNRPPEVHNLTERKRREKINDKMRALQELVPNCNKVDKATMLGEAIEYLRVLQFQVQMMSMRAQVCSPPVMSQPGLQQLHAVAHLPQFMPMGIGMGMGYQAGALDTTPGFLAQGACFPGSTNRPTHLWYSAQGLPMSMPVLPRLSAPMPGAAPHTLNHASAVTSMAAAENHNSMVPHLTL